MAGEGTRENRGDLDARKLIPPRVPCLRPGLEVYSFVPPPSYFLLQGSRPVQMIHWIMIAFNNCLVFAQDECR